VCKAGGLPPSWCRTSRKSEALTYPEHLGPPRPVAGDLYLIMNVCLHSFTFSAPYLAYIFIFGLSGSDFPHYLINGTFCGIRFSNFLGGFLYNFCLKQFPIIIRFQGETVINLCMSSCKVPDYLAQY